MLHQLWLVGILAFLFGLVYSRATQGRAFENLGPDEQGALNAAMREHASLGSLVAVLVAILAYLIASQHWPGSSVPAALFVTALVAFHFAMSARMMRAIRTARAPERYYRAVLNGRLVLGGSLVFLVVTLALRLRA